MSLVAVILLFSVFLQLLCPIKFAEAAKFVKTNWSAHHLVTVSL